MMAKKKQHSNSAPCASPAPAAVSVLLCGRDSTQAIFAFGTLMTLNCIVIIFLLMHHKTKQITLWELVAPVVGCPVRESNFQESVNWKQTKNLAPTLWLRNPLRAKDRRSICCRRVQCIFCHILCRKEEHQSQPSEAA